MRHKDAIIAAIALVFSLSALTGMACTEHFQRAAYAESTGFDALAHDLFNGASLAGTDQPQAGKAEAR